MTEITLVEVHKSSFAKAILTVLVSGNKHCSLKDGPGVWWTSLFPICVGNCADNPCEDLTAVTKCGTRRIS